jgi:hypothetical protein
MHTLRLALTWDSGKESTRAEPENWAEVQVSRQQAEV